LKQSKSINVNNDNFMFESWRQLTTEGLCVNINFLKYMKHIKRKLYPSLGPYTYPLDSKHQFQ